MGARPGLVRKPKNRTCNAVGLHTALCARPAIVTMAIKVAGFAAVLYACPDCAAKAPESLGHWTPL